jgi:acyl-CoA reductase-like NAD-dependent aldehyde dehydrogenase
MRYKMLIDGRLTSGSREIGVENPATGEEFERCSIADEALVKKAIAAAKAAFPAWKALSFLDRGARLGVLADALANNATEMAELLTKEQGKPLAQAHTEVAVSIAYLRVMATQDLPNKVLVDNKAEFIVETRTPLGVVVAIAPWNWPLGLIVCSVAPALLTGNTVVAKPAATTPLTTLFLAELTMGILPPGVFNVIADDNDLGPVLTAHPDVAKIAFTGSTRTGFDVLKSAATTFKRVVLELGGNDAAIVLDDVDIDEVAANIFQSAMQNSGQLCYAAKRVYAPRALYNQLCEALARLASQAVIGNGMSPSTQFGPIQNRAQFERLKGLIEDSRVHGKIIAGGELPEGSGYFVPPTIVRDLPDDARLVREEQFGPVLPVLQYENIDELIERVNDSEFGLSGSIWSKDTSRAFDIAQRIDAGTIWINSFTNTSFDVPSGGAKRSGVGVRFGKQGIEEFTQMRIISTAR